ncbi:MAG: response regulator [Gammaproteobacteria bacterium]|nr:response regulator [Gammaproteobacteria bacterium]MCP5135658.1 response regulator [Gammaproteobacteria bacterium]
MSAHVLIVEDSTIQRRLLERYLATDGYRLESAGNGHEGLEKAIADRPDLVVSDVMMPEMDGYALCEALRANDVTATVPVILLTTLAESKDVLRGLVAGADDYVIKPYEPDALRTKIKETLARGPHVPATGQFAFSYLGEMAHIPDDASSILRILITTYENVIRQNGELIDVHELERLAQRDLADKVSELELADRRYRHLLADSYSGFLRLDEDLRLLEHNPAFAEMIALTSEQLAELNDMTALFGDPTESERLFTALRTEGGVSSFPAHFSLTTTSTEGREEVREIVVEINARQEHDDNGDPYYDLFINDVTARTTAENALRMSEERLRSIMQLVPDIIYRINGRGELEYVNDAVSSLGYRAEDLLGKHFSVLLSDEDVPRVSRDAVLSAMSGSSTGDVKPPGLFDERRSGVRATHGLEVHLRAKQKDEASEPRIAEVNSAGIYVVDPKSMARRFIGSVGVARDITERRRHQDAMEALNRSLEQKVGERTRELHNSNVRLEGALKQLYDAEEQMVQSEKLSAVGTMVGGIAHELNNPLMGALNYVQFGVQHAGDEKLRTVLEKAERDIKRATAVIKSMLQYVRERNPEVGAIAVKTLIMGTLELLEPEMKVAGISVQVDLAEGLPDVQASEAGLQQVLVNLMVNARDALRTVDKREIQVIAKAGRSPGFVTIAIADSGPGIPEEIRRKVFDPFFTTKPPGKGTGLGLAISQRIVQSFGGTIRYRIAESGGARFDIDLPQYEAGSGLDDQAVAVGPTADSGSDS